MARDLTPCPLADCSGTRTDDHDPITGAANVPLIICPKMPKGLVGLIDLKHLQGEPSCPLLRKDP